MNNQLSNLIQLGLAIVVMSSSGVIGRYVDLPPPVTIWIRCMLGTLALYLVLKFGRISFKLGWGRHFQILFFSSVLMGLHWITYFYSLQLSNVAIGMLSLFTYPVMTALLEPLILQTRFRYSHLGLAIIAFAGVALLIPELTLKNDYTLGIVVGVFSALFYSIRNILLKKNISEHSGITLMFYQLLTLTILLVPVLFLFDFDMKQGIIANWHVLLLLGLFTTALGHTLFVLSFKHFSISTVSIISSLTPLLGAFLGYIFLDEVPAGRTLIGGLLIFLTVIAESLKSAREA